jgi:hypothetical protein
MGVQVPPRAPQIHLGKAVSLLNFRRDAAAGKIRHTFQIVPTIGQAVAKWLFLWLLLVLIQEH